MSAGDEITTYAEYRAALARDREALREFRAEQKVIELAKEDLLAAFDSVERNLEKGTEEGLAEAIRQFKVMFEHIDMEATEE